MSNIRLIALLEIFRKCITKVYTTRLERIIRENNILEKANFTGLIESSTENLILYLESDNRKSKRKKQREEER